jgi:hypothetical protein
MTMPEPRPGAAGPFDDEDAALLARLRAVYDRHDPPPAGLTDWVTLALSLDDIDVQVCRLTSDLNALATRAGEDSASTITFENNDLTIMLRLEERGDGQLRVDGWIAPAAEYDVEIRTGGRILTTRADGYGRFAVDLVPRGLAQMVLRPLQSSPGGRRATVTQPVVL